MAIDYIEIRNAGREIIGIIDNAKSVIWHSVYYGVGDFEVYAQADMDSVRLLSEGNYITKPGSSEVGIIENVSVDYSSTDGRMITASGRFAKSVLDRRLICRFNSGTHTNYATVIRGRVEKACRSLVQNNAINCYWDTARNIPLLELGADSGLPEIILSTSGTAADKQISYKNLLTYTDNLLQEYGLSASVILNDDTKKLRYICFKGTDRSVDNTEGNEAVVFSQEFDNLVESRYYIQTTGEKNVALIGGEGEGTNRFYSLIGTAEGLERRETWIDASSISKTYRDENEEEQAYPDYVYKAMLDTQGRQQLSELRRIEGLTGVIDTTNGQFLLNRDFWLGDIVTIQDNTIGVYINARVTETTEVQDENCYAVEIVFE